MSLTHAKGKYCRRNSSHICYCIRHEQYLKYVLFIIIMYAFHIFNEQNLTCTGTYTKKKPPNLHARLPFFLNKMEKKIKRTKIIPSGDYTNQRPKTHAHGRAISRSHVDLT
jgi:hypothetical protein